MSVLVHCSTVVSESIYKIKLIIYPQNEAVILRVTMFPNQLVMWQGHVSINRF